MRFSSTLIQLLKAMHIVTQSLSTTIIYHVLGNFVSPLNAHSEDRRFRTHRSEFRLYSPSSWIPFSILGNFLGFKAETFSIRAHEGFVGILYETSSDSARVPQTEIIPGTPRFFPNHKLLIPAPICSIYPMILFVPL